MVDSYSYRGFNPLKTSKNVKKKGAKSDTLTPILFLSLFSLRKGICLSEQILFDRTKVETYF